MAIIENHPHFILESWWDPPRERCRPAERHGQASAFDASRRSVRIVPNGDKRCRIQHYSARQGCGWRSAHRQFLDSV